MSSDKEIISVLGEFSKIMRAKLPEQRIFEDYFKLAKGFDIDIVKEAIKEWRYKNAFRFPSPQEFQEILVETAQNKECKGGPRTVTDLFGGRVRVETPLANRFRQIMKALIGTPVFRCGHIQFTGVITGQEAMEMTEEAEILFGPTHESSFPRRKTPDECLDDACYEKSLAIKATRKREEHKKLNEYERDELKKIARALLPYGYTVVTATEKELKLGKMDNDVWRDCFGLLNDYAERI